MDSYELAGMLFGASRSEGAESVTDNRDMTVYGVAKQSEDGSVLVHFTDDVTLPEDDGLEHDSYIELPSEVYVEDGDEVAITMSGGVMSAPRVSGVIGGGDRMNVRIAEIEADYVKASRLEADVADIGFLKADSAVITNLQADTAKVHNLTADQLSAATAYIASLNAGNVTAESLIADVGKVHTLTAAQLSAAAAYIAALDASSVTAQRIAAISGSFDTVQANAAKVANLTAQELEADHATIGSLDANYAQINLANVSNAWIASGVIRDAAISDGMINSVSANKLTAGTIDASNITVTNLNADNITTGTINGQRIGEGSLSLDKLSEDVYTEAEVDDIVDGLNDRIDGAIQTYTGTVVPTLNNSPADEWNTVALKDEHVGDVYYVVNSQSQQSGYCYRFTKSGSTYSWQLIKDSDVTAALSRLQTAEGKIGDIETFDSTVSSFMTNTDSELTSVKSRATSLETRMTDAEGDISEKVDTSTFNSLSQTVDGNSASITTMSTVLTNNGLTSSTNITNTVNSVSQTATGNSSKITQLTTTLGTNADGTTKAGDVVHRTSAVEQNLSGITTRVGTLESTTTSHGTRLTNAETSIGQNTDAIALRATKTEAYQIAQPNLSPYFSACQNTDFFTNSNYPIISAELGTIGTQLSDGWLHVDMDNSARSDAAYLNTWLKKPSWAKNSTEYTWLIEVRNFTLTSGSYIRFTPAQGNSAAQTSVTGYEDVTANGSYYVKSTTRSDATTNSAYTTFSRGLIQANAGVNASFDVRYSVYEGDYSGPYKPYGGDGFYATSAELTVTNNAVASKVSQTDYNGSTIASLINQSASTVQIQAQHIQLDGEVTFGAIESYADARYDAIGAAAAVQVGGRNLLQREWRVDDSGDKSGITYTCNADGSITLNGTSTAQHVFILAQSLTLSAGTYTFSGCPAGGGTNSYRLDILAVPLVGGTTASVPDSGRGMTFETTGGTTGQVRIRVVSGQTLTNLTFWPKLERGNRATDWSPAPEDMTAALAGTNESLTGAIADIGRIDTDMTAAAIATGVNLDKIRDSITSLRGGLNAEIDAREQWLNFKASEGLKIGESGSAFHTLITSTSMEFKNGGTTLATASGSEFESPVMRVTDELHMGGWMWTNRENGNLSLKWIG